MTMTTATAPGKIILAGEHAVVYGRPAIAIPVWQATAQANISDLPPGSGCRVNAPQVNINASLADLPPDDAIALVTRLALQRLALPQPPDWEIQLHSSIPIASGLGSGAAIERGAGTCDLQARRPGHRTGRGQPDRFRKRTTLPRYAQRH